MGRSRASFRPPALDKDEMPALSYLKISGTPFEAGRQLGQYGAPAVHRYLLGSHSWSEVMAWRGSDRVSAMAKLVRERFPRIWSELEGLAAGLRLPFDEVFLWNCRGDIWAFAPDGCTTVLLPGSAVQRITHNEDGDPGFAGDCAVVEYAVDGQPRLASFVYPGSIPGHTFAVTSSGLAVTVNNIRERQAAIGVPGQPVRFAASLPEDGCLPFSPGVNAGRWNITEKKRGGGGVPHGAFNEAEAGSDLFRADVRSQHAGEFRRENCDAHTSLSHPRLHRETHQITRSQLGIKRWGSATRTPRPHSLLTSQLSLLSDFWRF